MARIIDLRLEGDALFERRWVLARCESDRYVRRVDCLDDRRAVSIEIAVAAVDRLDRMAAGRQGSRTHLGAVADKWEAAQGRGSVEERDGPGRRVARIIDLRLERDTLLERRGVLARGQCN